MLPKTAVAKMGLLILVWHAIHLVYRSVACHRRTRPLVFDRWRILLINSSNLDLDRFGSIVRQNNAAVLRLINIAGLNLHFILAIRVSDVFGRPWFGDDPFKG